jgi:hypothetical protein
MVGLTPWRWSFWKNSRDFPMPVPQGNPIYD